MQIVQCPEDMKVGDDFEGRNVKRRFRSTFVWNDKHTTRALTQEGFSARSQIMRIDGETVVFGLA